MKKTTFENEPRAYQEGWGLFSADDGLRIQRLDDPLNSRPWKCFCTTRKGKPLVCPPCKKAGYKVRAPAEPPFACDEDLLQRFKEQEISVEILAEMCDGEEVSYDHILAEPTDPEDD